MLSGVAVKAHGATLAREKKNESMKERKKKVTGKKPAEQKEKKRRQVPTGPKTPVIMQMMIVESLTHP